jgi:hypothetical protein
MKLALILAVFLASFALVETSRAQSSSSTSFTGTVEAIAIAGATYAVQTALPVIFNVSSNVQAGDITSISWVTTMVVNSSGSCINVKSGSEGLGIDQQKCTGARNQKFTFTSTADGFYSIHPQNDTLCLDAGSGPVAKAIQVVQKVCNGSDPQKWRVTLNSDGSYAVTTRDATGCLDVYAGHTADGTIVTTFNCHGSSNQSFMMKGFRPAAASSSNKPAGPSSSKLPPLFTSTIVITSSKACVNVKPGSTQVGLGIDEWACTGTANQKFLFTRHPGGNYTIQPVVDRLCLDAGSGPATAAAQIVQNPCSGGSSQKWRLSANDNGTYSITTISGEGCFDVYAGRPANGTILSTYVCHNGDNQIFSLSTKGTKPSKSPEPSKPVSHNLANAPVIFNHSEGARPGDVIYAQGAHFDSTSQIWLSNAGGSGAQQLTVLNRVGSILISAKVPQEWTGSMFLWVTSSDGSSAPVTLNGALPYHLDAMLLVPGGAFKVLGLNLLLPGFSPSVTVDGQTATINIAASSVNMLVVTAPVSISPTSNAVITVDNGNETGPVQLDRTINVVSGSGDPFGLGVGWAAGFTFAGNVIPLSTPCDGTQDDSANIQSAINAVPSSGGVVQLPAGNCLLVKSLIMRSDVVLQGRGKNVTFLRYESNYPIWAMNLDLVGLRNLTLANTGSAVQGPWWTQNSRSFLQNVTINMGFTYQVYFTQNRNFIVTLTDFLQGGSLGETNPYLFSGCSGFVFSNNTSTSVDGSPTFGAALPGKLPPVHDALILNNHFTRNAANQNESPVIATHMFVMDFAYRMAIIGNAWDVINGPITNIYRNDGETLLTEGGGGNRTENEGTVASATINTITDPNNTINVNPFGTGLPENYGVAIVSGTGAGQNREVISYSNSTMQVDHPWDVIPDSTSHYATFVWGLEKTMIEGNTLIGNPRGIWLYQSATRDVDISNNTIINGGGIYLRTEQQSVNGVKQFDPMYNVRIQDNTISNEDSVWMSYVDSLFVIKDKANFGTAYTGVEIRHNSLTANTPNVTTSLEDRVTQEGFMNLMYSEASGGQLRKVPMVLGTIFQGNSCLNCRTAFVIGTGDYGIVLVNNQPPPRPPNFLADWQTLGSANPASIGTIIH